MKTYDINDLKDLYRKTNKFWKTGDRDYLDGRNELAMNICDKHWNWIEDVVSFTIAKHLPIKTAVDVLELFGYKAEGER